MQVAAPVRGAGGRGQPQSRALAERRGGRLADLRGEPVRGLELEADLRVRVGEAGLRVEPAGVALVQARAPP